MPDRDDPYAIDAGMINRRSPPTFIPTSPWSHPSMTWPVPRVNEKFVDESNGNPLKSVFVGSYSQPL